MSTGYEPHITLLISCDPLHLGADEIWKMKYTMIYNYLFYKLVNFYSYLEL